MLSVRSTIEQTRGRVEGQRFSSKSYAVQEWLGRKTVRNMAQRKNIRAFDNKMEKALEELSDEELVEYLPLFIAEVRKTDGTKYPPRSLHGIISSMQNHLRLQGREVNLFSDERFRLLRGSLDAAMKHSASEGLGATIK